MKVEREQYGSRQYLSDNLLGLPEWGEIVGQALLKQMRALNERTSRIEPDTLTIEVRYGSVFLDSPTWRDDPYSPRGLTVEARVVGVPRENEVTE